MRRIPSLVLVLLAALAAPRASAQELASEREAAILVRALAYDRALQARAGDAVVVAVVFRPGDAASAREAGAALAAFKTLEKLKISGLPFRAVQVAYQGPTALVDATKASGIDVLYVCGGLDADLPAIVAHTRGAKLTTMASNASYVHSGVALGLAVEEGKPRLLVNLEASRGEGAQFSSELMRLAKVIR